MSQGAAQHVKVEQLEVELAEIFLNAPAGLTGNTHLAIPGKPRSYNAMHHGLSGQHILVAADELQHYARMGLDHMRDIKPVGTLETGNAQLYFEDRWRLHRIMKIENDLFCIGRTTESDREAHARRPGTERQVNAFREEARNIDLISRYETRLVRNSGRMMDEIRKLRAERAKTNPDLIYDEQTNAAIDWYRRLLAQAERITKAREDYEEYEAARKAEAVNSTTSGEFSFGKKAGPEPPNPQEDSRPDRDGALFTEPPLQRSGAPGLANAPQT